MPLLIALGASLVLMRMVDTDTAPGRVKNSRGGQTMAHREIRLEDFYTGYRKNQLAPDEIVAWIKVPHATPDEWMRAYKISKRKEDDISAVCLALCLRLVDGMVQSASIGVGGVAATPVRAAATEAELQGKPWSSLSVQNAMDVLRSEFQPISDMRASAAYRSTVLAHLLQRYWLESQGQPASLDALITGVSV